jgi:hypothetical protein
MHEFSRRIFGIGVKFGTSGLSADISQPLADFREYDAVLPHDKRAALEQDSETISSAFSAST